MSGSRPRSSGRGAGFGILMGLALALCTQGSSAQVSEPIRRGPPRLTDFETDSDSDGVPDGWYNLRDGRLSGGGVVGPHCLHFEESKPGRPARISHAFGLDGRKHEAIVIGLWVRQETILPGERLGEDPGLMIDFYGDGLRASGRGRLGPWKGIGRTWTRVAKRIAVPPDTRDAIVSVGLLGASGSLDVDGITFDLVPVGGAKTTNLAANGDFELGDPDPPFWLLEAGAHRKSPGLDSDASIELPNSDSKALTGLSVPIRDVSTLEISLFARSEGLRGSGGAQAEIFFLDDDGKPLPGARSGTRLFRFSGSFDRREFRATAAVPTGADRAVFQAEKIDAAGKLTIDDVRVVASPDADAVTWAPYHETIDTSGWAAYAPSTDITAGSALDFSFLLESAGAASDRITVREGKLHRGNGPRARFLGVSLLPPLAFFESPRPEKLAERLALSGVNLVRLSDLDIPLGPGRSLFDDSRDDTKALDVVALANLEHLIARLKSRGIAVAIELNGGRRFREGDVELARQLPLGGGPAAAFDPRVRELRLEAAKQLLGHVNPDTGLALKEDPVLAWVTLTGETSLLDLIDQPDMLPAALAAELRDAARKTGRGAGRAGWSMVEAASWKSDAESLRAFGVKAPIAGSSHWRREAEFSAAQAAPGLDLIDDRLYWSPPRWAEPSVRAAVWDPAGNLGVPARRKRRPDRPYVVGQWATHTSGAWASLYEAADFLSGVRTAVLEDWDALVRRGVFQEPEVWGAAAPGTSGGIDAFPAPEALNANPAVFAFLPHAASAVMRGSDEGDHRPRGDTSLPGRTSLDTPYTLFLAGWAEEKPVTTADATVELRSKYAAIAVSSATKEPIVRSSRLLVTLMGRVHPTGMTWADSWRREPASYGRPPLLMEPVAATVTWKRRTPFRAFALDASGRRSKPVEVRSAAGGRRVDLDGRDGTNHWELVAE